jgi:7-carboxy-7-deazaguanine synthase
VGYTIDKLDAAQKQLLDAGTLLPVMEQFYTIQGEGHHTGKAAYFIRIGGCDVGCHWCDVKESWDASLHPLTSIETIVDAAVASAAETVVITGGEPLIYNLDALTALLRRKNIRTHIETSGAYKISGTWDWICLSPKKTMPPVDDIYQKAHELKVIIFNNHDLQWAEVQSQKVNSSCQLFLQPEWSRRSQMLPQIISYVKDHKKWRIGLQAHKYMNIP